MKVGFSFALGSQPLCEIFVKNAFVTPLKGPSALFQHNRTVHMGHEWSCLFFTSPNFGDAFTFADMIRLCAAITPH